MKKFIRVIAGSLTAIVLAVSLTGCGWSSVGPTEKGRLLSPSGYSPEIKEPGRHFKWVWQDMIKIDTATQVADEVIEDVVMKDRLMMDFNVQFRTRIDGNEKVLKAMFTDIKPQDEEITLAMVYKVYGQRTVQKVSRDVLSQYTVNEVLTNYGEVGNNLHKAITDALANEGSPLEVSNVILGKPTPPDSVMKVIEATEERREREALEEANQAIEVVKRDNAIVLAEKERERKIIEAETLRDQNKIVANGITPELIEYRRLEVMEKLGDNGNTIFYPYQDQGSVGLQNRIYGK